MNIATVLSTASAIRERRPEDLTLVTASEHQIASGNLELARRPSLDHLLEEAGLPGRTVHFLRLDPDGGDKDVLRHFDASRWAPWLLVAAVTDPRSSPRDVSWERRVLEAGYALCLFDGLNRFYVHPKHADARRAFLYPACASDEPFARAIAASRRIDDLEAIVSTTRRRLSDLERSNDDLATQLDRVTSSTSWRLTRPLRALRTKRQSLPPRKRGRALPRSKRGDFEEAFGHRLAVAACLLSGQVVSGDLDPDHALGALEHALADTTESGPAAAWLALVAAHGSFPEEQSVDRVARLWRMGGPPAVVAELRSQFERSVVVGSASTAHLDVVTGIPVVDVTLTADTDVHTGIQRVVRETVSRWLEAGHRFELAWFDSRVEGLRSLSPARADRLRNRVAVDGRHSNRDLGPAIQTVLVPWQSILIVPELILEPGRLKAYRGLARAGALEALAFIGYDLVPVTAAETAKEGFGDSFVQYLSVLKHADRVAAISVSSARDFEAFATMVRSQGLPGPVVEAHELPVEAREVSDEVVGRVRRTFGADQVPIVLVVGSHEPRKNHVAVLESAERLWAKGASFRLLMMGGQSWRADDFDEYADSLIAKGRPLEIVRTCDEDELWSAYRLARFSVFPSLLEGFGLPVAESLASGTPVITSSYGSMAEIGEAGGCLLVDPRDPAALEEAMLRLLDDDALLDRLRAEARARPTRSWNDYAAGVWTFLGEASP